MGNKITITLTASVARQVLLVLETPSVDDITGRLATAYWEIETALDKLK